MREIIALVVASLVAGAATTPFAAYHFHRLAPYGVLAILVAMPIVSAVAMPAGLLALALMSFGFDGPLWRLMGVGIAPLLVATLGLVVLGLLRSSPRFVGVPLLALAAVLAGRTPAPDVLVAADGTS